MPSWWRGSSGSRLSPCWWSLQQEQVSPWFLPRSSWRSRESFQEEVQTDGDVGLQEPELG